MARKSLKKCLLSELLDVATKLEGVLVSQVTTEVLAEVVEEAENIGVKVDLLDKVIRKVLNARDHQDFPHKVISIKDSWWCFRRN